MDEYSTEPNHFAKKSREIDVWIREDADCTRLLKYKPIDETYIKAKLIVPVEPEIIETIMDEIGCLPQEIEDKLIHRRWKCRFEEIV
jgi:hypothetical protein